MSLTELELNQQLVEALAECDRLRDRIAEMESFQHNYEHAVTIEREDWKQDRDRLLKDRHALARAIDPMSETAAAERSTKSLVKCAQYFHKQRRADHAAELTLLWQQFANLSAKLQAKEQARAQWAETAHRLREALKRYGQHESDCLWLTEPASTVCSCGFQAMLDPPAGEPKPGEGK